ncbi:F-box domain-containing protein [Xylariaceae sp. FL1651]|nr:F-box domain-containing protein [Xylariaceae sp. FL1651]
MAGTNHLHLLPDEILLHILHFIEVQDVVKLQSISKHFLRICRDNTLWRGRCLETSALHERVSLYRRGSDWVDEDGILLSRAATTSAGGHALQHQSVIENIGLLVSRKREREYVRIAANWDPTFPGEKTNWYHEYIQRNAPITTSWFEQPRVVRGSTEDTIDVRGVALYEPSRSRDELFALSPLDDGSVCLWDIKGTRSKKGSITFKSKPGLLWVDRTVSFSGRSSNFIDRGIIECVSVDNERRMAFFAVGNSLVEVDLQSMTVVARAPFEWMIMTMSAANPLVPLTVGTFNGLHLHDYRIGHQPREKHREVTESVKPNVVSDFSRIFEDPRPLSPYAALAQPGPQYIHHMESPGSQEHISDDIFVAGRFTSILHYDRRKFPSIMGSLHSGGRLCSLTSLPYPFSSIDSDLRRRLELSEEQVTKSKTVIGGRTLIACGEYNTKGSLEIYGLSSELEDGATQISYDSATKNRQTASRSKLLSVINHGNRIVFSDGQGYLKWVERDGFTEVRRHKVGKAEKVTQRSLFGTMPGSDDIARKLLSTQTEQHNGTPNDDDILFWTGETLGLVSFSSKPGFSTEDFVQSTKTPEEVATEEEEKLYGERMRLALGRQADEVRFVQNLGADSLRNGI